MRVSGTVLRLDEYLSGRQVSLSGSCQMASSRAATGVPLEEAGVVGRFRLGMAMRMVCKAATCLTALGLAATVGLFTAPVQAQVSFITAPTYAVGNYSFSITVGDLDGDGDLDLITANRGSYYYDFSTVSVLKNKGDGTFATAQNFAVGDGPTSITVGDLDGDGDLDLATANFGSYPDYIGTISVLKNNGDGTFAGPQSSVVGGSPQSITIGDLDGDGDLDLAAVNPAYNNVSVLENNGNGTFATAQNFATGDYPTSITVGDLDGDGDLDLATANIGSNNVSVLKNNGNSTFATPQNFAAEEGPTSIAVGDLDKDGDLDLATANRFSDNVSVFRNDGDGTFAAPQNFVALVQQG